ncbi:Hypothetical predicted protein [Olea europaea subsp. europaea]|uniref:Uncharacterized protein n=1 Tax=Olea europaea subsp. europaea TaxID=158383 RepID=A0A8S0U0E0_OLEEU|nr:Hypothetical predicted protein [Olea europaea subsp. europaea]
MDTFAVWDSMLGSWWDKIQLPTSLFVVELRCFVDGSFGILSDVAVLISITYVHGSLSRSRCPAPSRQKHVGKSPQKYSSRNRSMSQSRSWSRSPSRKTNHL